MILDLFVAWKSNEGTGIGVAMHKAAYKTNSRYNALHISPVMIELVRHAHQKGLVDLWPGNEASGMVTRIWPSTRLVALFEDARFGKLDVGRLQGQESIVLSSERRWLEYDDTPAVVAMRERLGSYNELLRRTFVDIPTLANPWVDLLSPGGERPSRVHVDQSHKFVRRIFYRGSWDYGGRLHGGFWQNLPKHWRSQIYINDLPTVEDDYSGLHITLLYGLEGQSLKGDDPYDLQLASAHSSGEMRGWVKALVLMAINASSDQSAFKAFRADQPTGSPAKRFTNAQLSDILAAFRIKHPAIAQYLGSDAGVWLMAMDGRITSEVIDTFTRRSIPVLSIHDSYIIDVHHTIELRAALEEAIKHEVPGITTATIKRLSMGYDQVMGLRRYGPTYVYDYLDSIPSFPRTMEYESRRDRFMDWLENQP